ncbi:unnamed protein product [Tetraodon nigroviridis]|uniref:(spotted green pufferfish) hypothetical protein n=1 Tax=Tetraodon nigroviridis TaxID=99883 RepID=Q4RIP8_TETNG|nr:unnamed protein product [Tetraodon nigroviridis]
MVNLHTCHRNLLLALGKTQSLKVNILKRFHKSNTFKVVCVCVCVIFPFCSLEKGECRLWVHPTQQSFLV